MSLKWDHWEQAIICLDPCVYKLQSFVFLFIAFVRRDFGSHAMYLAPCCSTFIFIGDDVSMLITRQFNFYDGSWLDAKHMSLQALKQLAKEQYLQL